MQMKQVSSSWKACERSDSIFLKEEKQDCYYWTPEKEETAQNLIQVVIWFCVCQNRLDFPMTKFQIKGKITVTNISLRDINTN